MACLNRIKLHGRWLFAARAISFFVFNGYCSGARPSPSVNHVFVGGSVQQRSSPPPATRRCSFADAPLPRILTRYVERAIKRTVLWSDPSTSHGWCATTHAISGRSTANSRCWPLTQRANYSRLGAVVPLPHTASAAFHNSSGSHKVISRS